MYFLISSPHSVSWPYHGVALLETDSDGRVIISLNFYNYNTSTRRHLAKSAFHDYML